MVRLSSSLSRVHAHARNATYIAAGLLSAVHMVADRSNRRICPPGWAVPAALLLTAAVSWIILASLNGQTIGLFHDDGLYVVVARALADGEGHRIISLPGSPFQTKYPPLYSAVLSVVWYLFPEFPANVFWLKALNVLFVAAALVGAALWARITVRPLTGVLLLAVIGTSPGIVTFSDYTMSDIAFVPIVVWYSFLWCRAMERNSRSLHVGIVLVSVAAVLTRSVGVALVVASTIECVWTRRWRWLAVHAAVPLAAFLAWSIWAAWYRDPNAGHLLSYYLQYETSALGYLRSDPSLTRDIILGNIALTAATLEFPVGAAWRLWGPIYVLFAAIGVWHLIRDGQRVPVVVGAVYLCLVLLHPFSPHRYLLPLIPLLLLAVLAGVERLSGAVTPSRRVSRVLCTVAIAVTAGSLIVPNLQLIRMRTLVAPDRVQGWYWLDMGYGWGGFEESFEWVRRFTPPDARLATMFDATYFLHTGRQAVRPWIHHSETYFYPLGQARPFVGEPRVVLAELRRLRIEYVVVDPPAGYAEGEAAVKMLRELLTLPEAGSRLVFTSEDGLHEIYRLVFQEPARPTVEPRQER